MQVREHTMRVCVCVARVVAGPVKCLWRKLTFQPYRKNTVDSFHLPFTWPEQFSFLILTSPLTPPLFLSLSLLCLCACLPVSPPSPKLPCLVCHLFPSQFLFLSHISLHCLAGSMEEDTTLPKGLQSWNKEREEGDASEGGPTDREKAAS